MGLQTGFIAVTASVDEFSIVMHAARVEGRAVVDHSEVTDSVVVSGSAKVSYSLLHSDAQIGGNATLFTSGANGSSSAYGNAVLSGVYMFDSSCVYGDAQLKGDFENWLLVMLHGSCKFGGNATFEGLRTVEDFVEKYGADKVELVGKRSNELYDRVVLTDVWDMG